MDLTTTSPLEDDSPFEDDYPHVPLLSLSTCTLANVTRKPSSFTNSRQTTNPFQATNTQAFSQNSLRSRDRPHPNQRSISTSRLERLTSSLEASNDRDVSFRNSTNNVGDGISIRGTAGPFIVVARNFAPGTTAADIESAMTPVGGTITSCRITRDVPTVVAEITFADKAGADSVILNFDKQKVI